MCKFINKSVCSCVGVDYPVKRKIGGLNRTGDYDSPNAHLNVADPGNKARFDRISYIFTIIKLKYYY
jgi:hypothetical protein